jgi:hypothetical protein
LKLVPKPSFHFRLELLEAHSINSILQPGVLATARTSKISTRKR